MWVMTRRYKLGVMCCVGRPFAQTRIEGLLGDFLLLIITQKTPVSASMTQSGWSDANPAILVTVTNVS